VALALLAAAHPSASEWGRTVRTGSDWDDAIPAAGFTLSGPATPVGRLVGDVWRSRALLVLLARKEFFVRYRRASFGVVWAVALPLLQAAVLAAVLSRFVRFETGDNFVLFVFSGTLAWNFFAGSAGAGATSIIDNADLSSKVYVPRAIFPLTVIGSGLYGLAISLVILIGMAAVMVGRPGLALLWLVPAIVTLVLLTSALALLLGAMQVYFRDVKYLVQAVLVPMFYLTPVFYPVAEVESLRHLVVANPMTGVLAQFRAAVFGSPVAGVALAWTLGWTVVLLVGAAWMYRRYDRVLSDLL
jgi:ABC-2 type transport system permease protein